MDNRFSYLFVCGCARSGTSALAQLLGNHERIIMGMERFGHLVTPGSFKLRPKHFKKDRFTKVKRGDTFYDNFEQYHKWEPTIKEKFHKFNYIGDKRPELYKVYNEIDQFFPGAYVIFIYRDVYDVAASWNARAKEGLNWPSKQDYRVAVYEWNQSLISTLDGIENGINITCICYEDVFVRNYNVEPLFQVLGLKIDEGTRKRRDNQLKVSSSLKRKRNSGERESGKTLPEEQIEYIKRIADFKSLSRLNKINIFST
jgi:hypothetical protein